jgi:flagellar hook-length control protein FliK
MVASAYGLPQGVGDQVAVQLTRAALDGLNRFSIQLHPADLGRVDVRLDLSHDGHVTAMVTADRHDTLNLLQRDARTLERSLQDLGFKMDSGGMQFSLKNQDQAFSQSSQPGYGGADSDLSVSEPSVSSAAIAAATSSAMSNRMLDIRV